MPLIVGRQILSSECVCGVCWPHNPMQESDATLAFSVQPRHKNINKSQSKRDVILCGMQDSSLILEKSPQGTFSESGCIFATDSLRLFMSDNITERVEILFVQPETDENHSRYKLRDSVCRNSDVTVIKHNSTKKQNKIHWFTSWFISTLFQQSWSLTWLKKT